MPVHPRLCGEHLPADPIVPSDAGSSPPVRGTRRRHQLLRRLRRFIPACAGNTKCPACRRLLQPVHPRLCGEHAGTVAVFMAVFGSSPPVRGTPGLTPSAGPKHRFIPACAGNTFRCVYLGSCKTVHPRLCGEHTGKNNVIPIRVGSSPPVRGTHRQEQRNTDPGRFIPACAGNTC